MSPSHLRASLLYNQGRYIDAEADLRAALAAGDDSSQAHALLGLCLLNSKLPREAREEIKLALERGPNDAFNHYAMSFVESSCGERTDFLARRGIVQYSKFARVSVQCALRAVELEPQNVQYLVRLAETFQAVGQWRASVEPVRSALRLQPDNCAAAVKLAEALTRLRQTKEAIAVLHRALEANPEKSLAHAGMGWALLRAGDPDRAEQFFNEALRMRADLQWAQAGALECAMQKFRLHRCLVWLHRQTGNDRLLVRVFARLALALAVLLFLFGYFTWIEPTTRYWLGDAGSAILTLLLIFCGGILFFFHNQIFLWLVRRHAAAQTSVGVERRSFDAKMLMVVVFAIMLIPLNFFLEKFTSAAPAILFALIPGVAALFVIKAHFSIGKRRNFWWVYVSVILMATPFAVLTLGHWLGEELKPIHTFLMALLPFLPVFIARDAEQKRVLKQKHSDALQTVNRAKRISPQNLK